MVNIKEYIQNQITEIELKTKHQIMTDFTASLEDHSFLKQKKSEYMRSDEFAALMQQKLAENKKYCQFTAENAENDPSIMRHYTAYTRRKRTQERKNNLRSMKDSITEYPLNINIESLLGTIAHSIADVLRNGVIKFKTQDDIRVELRQSNAEQFLEMIQNGMTESFLNSLIRSYSNGSIKEFGTAFTLELIKSDSSLASIINRKRGILSKHLASLPAVRDAIDETVHLLLALFTRDRILELISENPLYDRMIAQTIEEIRIEQIAHQLILKEIPENPIDLYPVARNLNRHFILHIGPTNSGKTYDALQCFYKSEKAIYLAPLRLLAYEIFERTNSNGIPCSMRTGEEHIDVPFAEHDSRTIEIMDYSVMYDAAVIDEAQLIADESRGGAWTAAILGTLARNIHVCAAPEAESLLVKLIRMCGDTYEIVRHVRNVPLVPDREKFIFPDSVKENDALIVFSKRSVMAVATVLQQQGFKVSMIYGNLPYDVRQNEVRRFISGETDVVVATDAIGMGLNLPVKRIVFLETKKFDGHTKRGLLPAEVQQIAGRAGRRGIYEIGYYTVEYGEKSITSKVEAVIPAIRKARLDFPDCLLGIDLPLSKIMSKWNDMSDTGIFVKSSIETELRLCKVLEQLTDDKKLIFDLVTIPFNEHNSELFHMWLVLAKQVISGKELFAAEWLIYVRDKLNTLSELNDLELLHSECDLLYFYFDRFGYKGYTNELCAYKKEISNRIIRILSIQQLEPQKCRSCGIELPWNYPYQYCRDCFEDSELSKRIIKIP